MAKSSKEKIEEDIKNIIYELQKNSNNSVNDIATKLGYSRQKVWRIIKDLEKNNTIWGYTAIVDDDKIQRRRFYILLKRAHVPITDNKIDIVINKEIKKMAIDFGVQLESSFFVNGLYDGVMCVTAEDISHVKMFIDRMIQDIGETLFSEANLLEVIFPIEKKGFYNPNLKELKELF
jgi:DNA-binding Lrp family transcriptional regulator